MLNLTGSGFFYFALRILRPDWSLRPHELFGDYYSVEMDSVNSVTTIGSESNGLRREGYAKALEQMRECCSEHGYLAATDPDTAGHYRQVWTRDSCITGMAALLTGDSELIDALQHSLEIAAAHQSPHGKIPTTYDPQIDRVSYGDSVGRIDADLWFVIACGAYFRHTKDDSFFNSMLQHLERVRFLLGAWEFNERDLIYVPIGGDWADQYAHSGYILCDQLLYLQALREFSALHRHMTGLIDYHLEEKISRLVRLIRTNYWFATDGIPEDVYHKDLYEKGRKAAPKRAGTHWMPVFSPAGYGYRFDALGNVLATLFGVAQDEHRIAVDDFIDKQIVPHEVMLLPAYAPPISPEDNKWSELQMLYQGKFRNEPYHYQNGGLWPMVTGFYAAALAASGKPELAEKYTRGIHEANRREKDGQLWSFPEYLDGKEFAPGGTRYMAWSAAAAVLAEKYLEGKRLFEHEIQSEPGIG